VTAARQPDAPDLITLRTVAHAGAWAYKRTLQAFQRFRPGVSPLSPAVPTILPTQITRFQGTVQEVYECRTYRPHPAVRTGEGSLRVSGPDSAPGAERELNITS